MPELEKAARVEHFQFPGFMKPVQMWELLAKHPPTPSHRPVSQEAQPR
jgi:hypothetical protein